MCVDAAPVHLARYGIVFKFRGLCDSAGLVHAKDSNGLPIDSISEALRLKSSGRRLIEHPSGVQPGDSDAKTEEASWALNTCQVIGLSNKQPVIVIDCTATDAITPALVKAIASSPHVRGATMLSTMHVRCLVSGQIMNRAWVLLLCAQVGIVMANKKPLSGDFGAFQILTSAAAAGYPIFLY